MQIKSIDALSLKIRLDQASVILIDIREPHEHTREHIEGARLVRLSRFQAEDFGAVHDKIAVFHWASLLSSWNSPSHGCAPVCGSRRISV